MVLLYQYTYTISSFLQCPGVPKILRQITRNKEKMEQVPSGGKKLGVRDQGLGKLGDKSKGWRKVGTHAQG